MSDYIKREDAIKIINSGISTDTDADRRYVNGLFRAIRPADVAPVRHGRFVPFEDALMDTCWECSECGLEFYLADGGTPKENSYNYCPNCGARMDGEGK